MDDETPSSPPNPEAGRRAMALIGVVTVLTALAIAAGFLWSRHDEASRVAHDPHVRGKVVDLAERKDDESSGTAMDLVVEFTTLDGRTVVLREQEQMNGRDALRVLERGEVDVWYRRDNPEDALVRWEGGAR
jgi:Protein of unknown function (DUF3592)